MEVLYREAKFKLFFIALGIPFVFLGLFGFIFMGSALGFDFPPPYMCLIFFVVGLIVIFIDLSAWARYFKGKRTAKDGEDGTGVFLSFFRSTYYISNSTAFPRSKRLNLYGIEFSFKDGDGKEIRKKTPAFLKPCETEALRTLGEFQIRHQEGFAVIVHDLEYAVKKLNLEEVTQLD